MGKSTERASKESKASVFDALAQKLEQWEEQVSSLVMTTYRQQSEFNAATKSRKRELAQEWLNSVGHYRKQLFELEHTNLREAIWELEYFNKHVTSQSLKDKYAKIEEAFSDYFPCHDELEEIIESGKPLQRYCLVSSWEIRFKVEETTSLLRHVVAKKQAEIVQKIEETEPQAENEGISEVIGKLEVLKQAKEAHDDYRKAHDKSHLGLSPDSAQETLWSKAQQLIGEIELDLVRLEDCITAHSNVEDDFGGWVIPTGTFRQNLIRDIKYALKSKDAADMDPLIQQFKKIQRRLDIKSPQEQEEKTKPPKEPSAKQRGCPKKNTDDQCKRMQKAYDETLGKANGSQDAWRQVAENFGMVSGKAAQQACYRYRKRNK